MLIQEILKAINYLMVILLFSNPIEYKEELLTLNNHQQKVYTLQVDMNSDNIEVSNALSFDMFYGFETTSDMASYGAYAAINGMFYDEYGYPLGIIVKDGDVISTNKTGKPSVVIDYEGNAIIEDIDLNVRLTYEDGQSTFVSVNKPVYDGEYVLFDENYGRNTKVRRGSINYHINDSSVTDITITDDPVNLSEDDYILTYVGESNVLNFEVGDKVEVSYEYSKGITDVKEAFQTGGWLVKDGINISEDYDNLIGNTNIPNPRTIIGVDKGGAMIIKVIDGRSDESFGVTGDECAELMIAEGCVSAVYLDGGASSTMVVNDKVVNSPSIGEEREVAHSIIIKYPAIYVFKE